MNTDHTETPEVNACLGTPHHYHRVLEKARQLEKERNEARAALATAMEERDKLLQAPLCAGHAEAWYCDRNHLKPESGCIWCDLTQERDALRSPNDALTKALEDERTRLNFMISYGAYIAHSRDGEVCNVWLPADEGDEERPAEGYPQKCYHDAREAIDGARRALGKEGL